MSAFQTLGIVARLHIDKAAETLAALLAFLATRQVQVVLEADTAQLLPDSACERLSRAQLGARCDLIIVVGGDGSLLGIGREFAASGIPVVGINRGGLGFLADIAPDQIEHKLGLVLDGDFVIEQRFLLHAEIRRQDMLLAASEALNDVVVHSGTMSRMMEFALAINGEFVYDQHSDGLIIASPTGSTAYNLSAGGPIMHPRLDAIAIVPMFPHTLTSRPLVVPGSVEIALELLGANAHQPQVSCDSQVDMPIEVGDRVIIRKSAHSLHLLYPPGHNFYESCRSKLDWGSRLGGRS